VSRSVLVNVANDGVEVRAVGKEGFAFSHWADDSHLEKVAPPVAATEWTSVRLTDSTDGTRISGTYAGGRNYESPESFSKRFQLGYPSGGHFSMSFDSSSAVTLSTPLHLKVSHLETTKDIDTGRSWSGVRLERTGNELLITGLYYGGELLVEDKPLSVALSPVRVTVEFLNVPSQ
jgi:hypothetical protein